MYSHWKVVKFVSIYILYFDDKITNMQKAGIVMPNAQKWEKLTSVTLSNFLTKNQDHLPLQHTVCLGKYFFFHEIRS